MWKRDEQKENERLTGSVQKEKLKETFMRVFVKIKVRNRKNA